MPAPYAGSPVFPDDFPLVDDGVSPNGTNFNPALEALGDRTAYLKALADASQCVPVVTEYLADATFTLPTNALPWVIYSGCGGGGHGGHGGQSQPRGITNSGGGGGGGAQLVSGICHGYPGEAHLVQVGTGGATSDPLFGIGDSGGDTIFSRVSTSEKLAVCRGAGGGQAGQITGFGDYGQTVRTFRNQSGDSTDEEDNYVFARGGSPVRPETFSIEIVAAPSTDSGANYSQAPGAGGAGISQSSQGRVGGPSSSGFAGGAAGLFGANHPTETFTFGGGAGGGGGGGAYGVGGDGGNGSAATGSTSASAAPIAGSDAAANTGAGGGGGGGAGCGTPTSTNGAAAGKGGSGRLRIIYFIPMELP